MFSHRTFHLHLGISVKKEEKKHQPNIKCTVLLRIFFSRFPRLFPLLIIRCFKCLNQLPHIYRWKLQLQSAHTFDLLLKCVKGCCRLSSFSQLFISCSCAGIYPKLMDKIIIYKCNMLWNVYMIRVSGKFEHTFRNYLKVICEINRCVERNANKEHTNFP